MDRKVLRDPAVAGYINDKFVPLRVEVTSADADLLRRYDLPRQAPMFLILGPDGEELDRQLGAMSVEEFLGFLKDAVGGNHFAALDRRAREGEGGCDFLLSYGRRLYGRGAPEAALVLRRVVDLDREEKRPGTVDAQYMLARLAPGDESVAALARFVGAHPGSVHAVEAHRTLAMTYAARGSVDEAIGSFEFLRSRGALEAPWQVHDYARLLAWNGRQVERALALVDDALRAVPDEPRWLDTRAECLSRLGRYEDAIATESRAVEKAQRPEDRREFERALYEMKKRRAEAAR